MERVITVHGIWTEGRWQEEVAPVLYPHFVPASVKYRSYRFLGPLNLLIEPWVLLPGLVLWGASLLLLWWWAWLQLKMGVLLGVLLIAIFVAAHLLVVIRLGRTVQKFLDDSVAELLTGRIHIIAHSLGSYIVCTALRNEETMFAQRVVLAGCVVDTNFAWAHVSGQRKFVDVRNEVAGGDLVAWAAKFLRWRFPDFGRAGRNGFREAANLVHTVESPNHRCLVQPDTARVHNFVSAKKGHSDVLKMPYVKYYWLPFFWNIDPHEFREFLDACKEMMEALKRAGSPNAPPPEGDFNRLAKEFVLERKWAWAGGETIVKYLNDTGRPIGALGDEKIIAFNLCFAVIQAEVSLGAKVQKWKEDPAARQRYHSEEHDEAIKALDPAIAVTRAFDAYKG